VVAVIDDTPSAEQAVRAFSDAGQDDDVDLLDGSTVVEANQSVRQRGGRLRKFETWLSAVFSDEAKYARTCVLEAQRGHYLVVAHAVQPEVAHGDQLELFIVRKAGIYDARGERGHVQTRTGGPRCWVR